MQLNIIKSERVKRGLKQRDMGEMLGINYHSYVAKENGLQKFSWTECLRMAKEFGYSLQEANDILFDHELDFFVNQLPDGKSD